MSTRSAWTIPLTVVSLLATGSLARGQTPSPTASASASASVSAEATAHFEMGTRHYNLQEWGDAVREYKEAYRLAPRPETLWSIAQSQRLGGDHDAAIMTYQAFLRTSPPERQAALANEAIVKCQAALLDKRKADPNPSPAIPAKRGDPSPPGTSGAPPATGTFTGAAPSAAASATPPATAPAAGHWYTDVLGDVLFLGGAAGVVFGGVALGMGNAKVGDSNAATDYATFDRTRGEGPPLQMAGVLGLAVGGALLATGVVRFVLVARRPASEPGAADVRPLNQASVRPSDQASVRPSSPREAARETAIGVGAGPTSVLLRVTGQF